MSIKVNPDFSELDAVLAEQILRNIGGETMRRAVSNLLGQGASKNQIVGRLRELLPTWEGTAVCAGCTVTIGGDKLVERRCEI